MTLEDRHQKLLGCLEMISEDLPYISEQELEILRLQAMLKKMQKLAYKATKEDELSK